MKHLYYSVFFIVILSICACQPVLHKPESTMKTQPDQSSVKVNQTPVLSLTEYLDQAKWDEGSRLDFPVPEQFVMANGLKVYVVERHDLPMVYARAQIRGGSIYDPQDKEGLSYLTGWVLTEGTESYPDKTIESVMDQSGAFVTSVAYNESCIATLTCLSKDTQKLFPYFAEILSRAKFEEKKLDEGRQYIIGDLIRMNDDPGELCYRYFRQFVFGDHPYSKPQKGSVEGLMNCSRQDVLDFYHRYYTPNQAVLVFVGDVSLDVVRGMCDSYLSQWSNSDEASEIIHEAKMSSEVKIKIIDKDTVQAQINMGHVGINRTDPDRFKLRVLNSILGGSGLYSRLATEVRVKRGLTYGVYSFFAQREFTGEFAVSTFTKLETCKETIQVILNELNRIRTETVSDDELEDAKQSLIGSFPLAFEEYEGIAQTLVHSAFYKLPRTDTTDFPIYIRNVTKEDVLAAAQKHIHPEDIIIVVTGPAEKLAPELESLGPVEIIHPE